jgi:hypothetical protein
MEQSLLIGGLAFLFLVVTVSLVFYFMFRKSNTPANVNDKIAEQKAKVESTAATVGAKREGLAATAANKKEGFVDGAKAKDLTLLKLQPLTIKQAGFIGPVTDGVFDEKDAVIHALKAGIRTLVLQIDYHEDPSKGAPLFPTVGEPCLLVRDAGGTLISLNSGSIQKVADAIAQYAFSNTIQAKEDPIVLILYGNRAPDRITKPKEYLQYLSQIAKQLKGLAPFHLGLTPMGDYHRQALAGQVFIEPFKHFEKKVLILSNFETSLFRNVTELGMQPYAPSEDLDYWVNAQIFKQDEKASLGVTGVAPAKTPVRTAVYDIEHLKALTGDARTAWATKHKDIFTMVLPDSAGNPDYDTIGKLLNELGVNVVPIDIFSFDTPTVKRTISAWSTSTWREKPVTLQ